MACGADVATRAGIHHGADWRAVLPDRRRRLELHDAAGATLAVLAVQSQQLAGTRWRATGIKNGSEAVVGIIRDTSVTLAFGTDGRATGSAGCNSYTTTYEANGSKVTFAPAATTRKMCPQPEGVMQQESAFLKALESIVAARVDGDRLELRSASGALAVSLTRDEGG